jgi:predicted nucleotidyltransferase
MVDQAARSWTEKMVQSRKEILQIGYFGSYARGDWGVGSDLDLIVILESSDQPFEKRSLAWDTRELPVPVDLLIYTKDEWKKLGQEGGRFYQTVMREAIWIYTKPDFTSFPIKTEIKEISDKNGL